MSYQAAFMPLFKKRVQHYQSLRPRIESIVNAIVSNPFFQTEQLKFKKGSNLKGCRSARVGTNFRIIFVICEECRKEPECEYCYCEGLADQTIVFLTVGPHDKAYSMR